MDVVYSSSDLYSELAAVSIVSMLENCRDVDDIDIWLINKSISDQHKDEIRKMVERYGRMIYFVRDVDVEEIVQTRIEVFKWNLSTFSRLFLSHVLPEDVERVIYIDCDMIVRHSLRPLWEMDMGDAWVMAVDDCRSKRYRDDIGIDRSSIYTNNGLMLINLKAWRENEVESLFIGFIKRYGGNVTYVDQGVLNGVMQPLGMVGLLPVEYNAKSEFFYLGYDGLEACRKPVWAYSKDEFEHGMADPTIVHFTSCFYEGSRPWEKVDDHPYRGEFLRYRDMTSWAGRELWENKESAAKRVAYTLCKALPKCVTFAIVGVLHSWAFPMLRAVRGRLLAHSIKSFD